MTAGKSTWAGAATRTPKCPASLDIESSARGANEGFGRNATHIETIAAQEMFLDQRHFRPKACRPGRRHQPSRPRADDDEIVAGRGRGILPIARVDIGNEARVVGVRRRDQDRAARARS